MRFQKSPSARVLCPFYCRCDIRDRTENNNARREREDATKYVDVDRNDRDWRFRTDDCVQLPQESDDLYLKIMFYNRTRAAL